MTTFYPEAEPAPEYTRTAGEEHGQAKHSADLDHPDAMLQAFGYAPELVRNRSTFQVAFMSFVLASIPYGLATTLFYPLNGGGSSCVIWGWFAVSLIIMCVAASLGEITSVFPTAGGVYYQTYMLSPHWCRRITAWICGWSSVIGQITITLSVQFGTTLFLIACINIFQTTDPATGVSTGIFAGTSWQTFLVFLAIVIVCNLICAFGNKWLPLIDTFAVFWTFIGVIALVIVILALAKDGRRSAKFVFTDFSVQSGWPSPGWSWMVGLLHAAYATSSTGMIINMAEEVRDPAGQIPKAMLWTVVANTIGGLVFLIALMFVLPDIADVLVAQPVPIIVKAAVGNDGGAFALTIPLLVLAIICGVGCTTATSRCIWSFARDEAIPGFQLWNKVNKKLDVPLNAMMLSMLVQILLGLIYFGSPVAFNAFSGTGVISLTVSYAMPIAVSLIGGRKFVKNGRFNLGSFGVLCNVVAIAWTLLVIPLFCMPSNLPVTASTVNYAPVVFVAFTAISAIWYFVYGKTHYTGPPTHQGDIPDLLDANHVRKE